jgi:hypothetical protein
MCGPPELEEVPMPIVGGLDIHRKQIKNILVRSIRRAQKYDLIVRNVAELVDLPQGQPGHLSRAMTEEPRNVDPVRQGGSSPPGDGPPIPRRSHSDGVELCVTTGGLPGTVLPRA